VRDDRTDAAPARREAIVAAVISLVGERGARGDVERCLELGAVADLSAGQMKADGQADDGVFAGTIKTLSLDVTARLIPADASSNDKAPYLRVLVGNVEIDAAWRRTSQENTEYHSVKLDDPSLPAPIYGNLFKGETDYTLVWSR